MAMQPCWDGSNRRTCFRMKKQSCRQHRTSLSIASGAWSLVTTTYKKPTATLAEGHLTIDRDKWHEFALSMREDGIIVSVERKQLADVYDGSHARGFFGIGSGWNVIQFDNLRVIPGPDTPVRQRFRTVSSP